MQCVVSFLPLILLQPQDDPARQIYELIEKLRSDKIEQREEAHAALTVMGNEALKGLRRAIADSDPEVAGRARSILDRILNSAEWIQYRDSHRLGIEWQGDRSAIVLHRDLYRIILDPREVLGKLQTHVVILEREGVTFSELCKILGDFAKPHDLELSVSTRPFSMKLLHVSSRRLSLLYFLREVLPSLDLDIRLTREGRMVLESRRLTFGAIQKDDVKWPIREFIGTAPFRLDERNPDRY